MRRDWWALAAFAALTVGVEIASSLFTASSAGTWYRTLAKPSWTPPNWLFGPVWTVLYLSMAVAAWLVWRERAAQPVAVALTLFSVQLTANFLWSLLFFGMRSPLFGLIDIVLLWVAILATVVAFARVRPAAGWLLVPYLAWVGYAAALNFAIWRLNR